MLRNVFWAVLALSLFLGIPAAVFGQAGNVPGPFACPSNSPGPGQGGYYYCQIDALGHLIVTVASAPPVVITQNTPAPTFYVTTSGVTVIKNAAGILYSVDDAGTSVETANCTMYDNASVASGNVLFAEQSMGVMQVITWAPYGKKAANGLTITCNAVPSPPLAVVYQ